MKSREKVVLFLSGVALIFLIGALAIYWEDIVRAYVLRRLYAEKEYVDRLINKNRNEIENSALEEFASSIEGTAFLVSRVLRVIKGHTNLEEPPCNNWPKVVVGLCKSEDNEENEWDSVWHIQGLGLEMESPRWEKNAQDDKKALTTIGNLFEKMSKSQFQIEGCHNHKFRIIKADDAISGLINKGNKREYLLFFKKRSHEFACVAEKIMNQ